MGLLPFEDPKAAVETLDAKLLEGLVQEGERVRRGGRAVHGRSRFSTIFPALPERWSSTDASMGLRMRSSTPRR